jgi:hypothetical protein
MIKVNEVIQLQTDTVERWHREPVDNPYSDFLQSVCTQHQFNYLLWHEEDIARSPEVGDTEIASVKRKIDKYNQQRNDWIERVDDCITEKVEARDIELAEDAKLNTETPGSVIDRLSIMSLRLYHLDEQLQRNDVEDSHRESVQHKIAICRLQQSELGNSLQELLEDIFSGRKRHRTYRQFKMYNDPALNPYLYNAEKS